MKYLNLYSKNKNYYINLSGGDTLQTDKNIILTTHNARMRCFLEDVMGDKMKEYRQKNHVKEIRLKNCATLKLEINVTSADNFMGKLSLIYEGEVNRPKKGAYFIENNSTLTNDKVLPTVGIETNIKTKDNNIVKFVIFEPYEFNQNNLKLNLNVTVFPQKYNIYMVRHGEGTHNITSFNTIKDTLLTDSGKKQAEMVAAILCSEFITYDYCFSSYLKRTRQTLEVIMRLLKECDKINTNKMIVVPCSHELYYKEGGKCDGASFKPPALENQMQCNTTFKDTDMNKNDNCQMVNNVSIDWTFYNIFYNNKSKCRNSNMIKEIINIINTIKPDSKDTVSNNPSNTKNAEIKGKNDAEINEKKDAEIKGKKDDEIKGKNDAEINVKKDA